MRDMRLAPVGATETHSDIVELPVRPAGWLSYGNAAMLVAMTDFLAIVMAALFAGYGYHLAVFQPLPDVSSFLAIGITSGLIFLLVAKSLGQYTMPGLISGAGRVQSLVVAWIFAFLVFSAVLLLLKIGDQYSRGTIFSFGLVALGLLLWLRRRVGATLLRRLREGTLAARRGILIGTRSELERVGVRELVELHGTLVAGRFQVSEQGDRDAAVKDRWVVQQAIEFARANNVERILLALPWTDATRLHAVSEQLRTLPLSVVLLPDKVASEVVLPTGRLSGSELSVELSRSPLTVAEQAAKRALDIAVVGTGALALLPVLVVIAAAIKLTSRGPVLFRQDRIGFNGQPFSIYKFRTMTVMENGPVIRQASFNDVRVTRVGRLLRVSSLDELPQFLNVLRGEMSLVGPRPHAIAHHNEYEKAIAKYAYRHNVKPGITGWAQVNGLRGATPRLEMMASRVDADLWYIRNWSLWLDLRILTMTLLEIVRPRNAH